MKLSEKQIESHFTSACWYITHGIDVRLNKFKCDYDKKMFGKSFFLDIEVQNCMIDLIYHREQLEVHFKLCRINKVNLDSHPVTHATHYHKRLIDIELKGFLQILKIKDPWFPYSQKQKDKMNAELCKIAKEVCKEMKLK